MRMASLVFLVIAFSPAPLLAQNTQRPSNSSPAQPPTQPAEQRLIRQKYRAVQVDEFVVKQGIEFPPEYVKKAQQEILKQLAPAKVFDQVWRTGQPPTQAGTPVIRVSGTVHNYDQGNRAKRYVGGPFGAGLPEVAVQIA